MASDTREDAVLGAFSCEIMVEEKRPTIPIGSYESQRPSLLGYNLYTDSYEEIYLYAQDHTHHTLVAPLQALKQ